MCVVFCVTMWDTFEMCSPSFFHPEKTGWDCCLWTSALSVDLVSTQLGAWLSLGNLQLGLANVQFLVN